MQFRPFEPGIEVWGISLEAFISAFKLFPSIGLKRLAAGGIGTMRGKDVVVDKDAWYPQDKWLAVFESLAAEMGPRTLVQIGQNVPKHAPFPPTIMDIHSAIAALNVAYHMNHRKQGKVMADPATGKLMSGIGSYGYAPVPGERRIVSVCENPYPCDFDRGIITALASRFEKTSKVTHDDGAPCRKQGADSCRFIISW